MPATPSSSCSVGIASAHASRAGDVRAGGVGEPDRALERPAVQQPVDERAAERVAGAEAADDLDRHRRHLDALRRACARARPRARA